MEIVKLKLSALEPNTGQIPGLPINPRQWTKSDVDSLARSLTETPELFEARPLLVVPHEGKYVILGGNLRYEASKQNKANEVPCVVFPADMPIEKMKEIVVKDNGSFGAWDYDSLANEWGDLPLADWGVPVWDDPAEDEIDLGTGDMKETERLSGLEYEPLYFEPTEKPVLRLADCYNDDKFRAKIAALDEYDLTPEQKQLLTIFAYRFIKIDFEAVANYYYFNASEEEKKAIERLRLVLVDDGSIAGFAEDGLLKVADLAIEDARETEA